MTPEQFREAMKEIDAKYGADTEGAHALADDLICKVLRELGYGEGIDAFEAMHKWYA